MIGISRLMEKWWNPIRLATKSQRHKDPQRENISISLSLWSLCASVSLWQFFSTIGLATKSRRHKESQRETVLISLSLWVLGALVTLWRHSSAGGLATKGNYVDSSLFVRPWCLCDFVALFPSFRSGKGWLSRLRMGDPAGRDEREVRPAECNPTWRLPAVFL